MLQQSSDHGLFPLTNSSVCYPAHFWGRVVRLANTYQQGEQQVMNHLLINMNLALSWYKLQAMQEYHIRSKIAQGSVNVPIWGFWTSLYIICWKLYPPKGGWCSIGTFTYIYQPLLQGIYRFWSCDLRHRSHQFDIQLTRVGPAL